MNRTHYLLPLLLLLMLGLLAAGCAPPPAAEAALQATETPTAVMGEHSTTLETPVEPGTADEMPVVAATEVVDNYCIECHSDAERLQDLAFVPTPMPSLSEGSG